MCNEDGGALDDCTAYRRQDRWMIVVNASGRTDDLGWVKSHASSYDVEVKDISNDIALIALQGPKSQEILSKLTDAHLNDIAYYLARPIARTPDPVDEAAFRIENQWLCTA